MNDFRDLMSQYAKSVFILATNIDGYIRLTTVSSVVSLEVEMSRPQILLVTKRGLASELQRSGNSTFSISLLHSGQKKIAQSCSKKDRKMIDYEMFLKKPISQSFIEVTGSIFTLSCRLSNYLESQMNEVIIADVTSFRGEPSSLKPLLHYRRKYFHLDESL